MKNKKATIEKEIEKAKPIRSSIEEEELGDKHPEDPNPEELTETAEDEGFVEDSYDEVSEF